MSADLENCPVCGRVYVASCKCLLADRRCSAGHEWHYCLVHDRVVVGPSDHSKETTKCHCDDKEQR
jgi:hypothetical protein